MATKRCTKCWRDLPPGEFRSTGRGSYVSGFCKSCAAADRRRLEATKKLVAHGYGAPCPNRLPVEPFRQWLLVRLEKHDGSMDRLAESLGLVERRVRAIVNGETTWVSFDMVDRATTMDPLDRIEDIYPERVLAA